MDSHILSQFNANTLVLTANRRLAKVAQKEYDLQQRQLGHPIWATPRILPFESWLIDLWRSHPLGPERILTDFQEYLIWSKVIQKTSNTAQAAQQAWRLWQEWEIAEDKIKTQPDSVQTAAFIEWADAFTAFCRQTESMSIAALPRRLRETLPTAQICWPQHIFVMGFAETPPAYRLLLDLFRQHTLVTEITGAHQPGESKALIFPDIHTEITTMAHWAALHRKTQPKYTIACIIPQLTEHRPTVVDIFNQTVGHTAYNISAGDALSRLPMIATALQALALGFGELPLETLHHCLQSPYLSLHETDRNLGALCDAALRKTHRFTLPLPALFNAIAEWQPHYPQNTWLKRWRAFLNISKDTPQSQSPSRWAAHFIEQLRALGWPGGRSLNSLEHQTLQRWLELCHEFSMLDPWMNAMDHDTAYRWLCRLAERTIFQPQLPLEENPIQILGLLESSDLCFDAVWVMGMDDQSWPPPACPNPYLPYWLQKKLQMPHSSTQREWAYAQHTTIRLFSAGRSVYFSCSAARTDQKPRLSPLLKNVPLISASELLLPPTMTRAEILFSHSRKESVVDDRAPPITHPQKIQGGSGILTQQSECPFRAFALFRLEAKALSGSFLGISPLEHGILLHAALDKIWGILKNQQTLLAMPDAELQAHITKCAEEVISKRSADAQDQDKPFLALEKNRLVQGISEWLDLEKKRPPFQVIERETEREVKVGKLTLKIKIDRIDQLSDGSLMMLDYKTGFASPKAWFDERISQPQLPLYCSYAQNANFSAVAFAQLRAEEMGFKGVHQKSDDDNAASVFPPGVKPIDQCRENETHKTWAELLTHWRSTLLQLSEDFYSGDAKVNPANHGLPCKTCDLQSLCRIHTFTNLL